MSEVVYSSTREDEAVALLTEQFKNKATLDAFLRALVAESQALEDVALQLRTERTVDAAVGAQLNRVGAIVGETRQGRPDAVYRLWIKARIRVNRSSGGTRDMYAVARILLGSDVALWLRQFPIGHTMEVTEDYRPDIDAFAVQAILQQASAAGVPLYYTFRDFPEEPTAYAFTLASGATVSSSDYGFGSGRLVSQVYGDTQDNQDPVRFLPELADQWTADYLSAGTTLTWESEGGVTATASADPPLVVEDDYSNGHSSIESQGGTTPLVFTPDEGMVSALSGAAFTVTWWGSQKSTGASFRTILYATDDAGDNLVQVSVTGAEELRLIRKVAGGSLRIMDTAGGAIADTNDHAFSVVYEYASGTDGTTTFYLDGALLSADSDPHDGSLDGLTSASLLGRDVLSQEWGKAARIAVVGRAMTASEIEFHHAWLAHRYKD